MSAPIKILISFALIAVGAIAAKWYPIFTRHEKNFTLEPQLISLSTEAARNALAG